MIIKYNQIMENLTSIVVKYIAKGYTICNKCRYISNNYNYFIDLRKNKEVVRIAITNEEDCTPYIRLVVDKEILSDMDMWKTIYEKQYFFVKGNINTEESVYTDDVDEYWKLYNLRVSRFNNRYNSFYEDITSDNMISKALEILHRRKGYKRIKADDIWCIDRQQRYRGVSYYIRFKDIDRDDVIIRKTPLTRED